MMGSDLIKTAFKVARYIDQKKGKCRLMSMFMFMSIRVHVYVYVDVDIGVHVYAYVYVYVYVYVYNETATYSVGHLLTLVELFLASHRKLKCGERLGARERLC